MIQHEDVVIDILSVKLLKVQRHLFRQLEIATGRPEYRKLTLASG